MNLHGLVRGIVTAVNPDTNIVLKRSTGYSTTASGKQVPSYAAPEFGPANIQPMGKADLRHMADLNITGVFRKVYLFGALSSGIRGIKTGGDLLSFPIDPSQKVQTQSFAFLAPATVGGRAYLAQQFTSVSAVDDWKVVDVLETWPGWCSVAVVLQ